MNCFDEFSALQNFCALVIQSLLTAVAGDEDGEAVASVTSTCSPTWSDGAHVQQWFNEAQAQERNHVDRCVASVAALPANCVLARLLDVQSLGDVDFTTLYDAYDAMVKRFVDDSFSYDNMRWTHPQMTADWLSAATAAAAAAAVTEDVEEVVPPTIDMALQESIRLVQRYRISSTSRDCSIMIAFQRIHQQQ